MGPDQMLQAKESDIVVASHVSPPSKVIKNASDKAEKEKRELSTPDVEELAKQTLLSFEDVQMWIKHLALVKKQRPEGAREAAATRKKKVSAQQAQSKASTSLETSQTRTTNEPLCICGGPESGDLIACDSPYCQIGWFHFTCVGVQEAPSGDWTCPECLALNS